MPCAVRVLRVLRASNRMHRAPSWPGRLMSILTCHMQSPWNSSSDHQRKSYGKSLRSVPFYATMGSHRTPHWRRQAPCDFSEGRRIYMIVWAVAWDIPRDPGKCSIGSHGTSQEEPLETSVHPWEVRWEKNHGISYGISMGTRGKSHEKSRGICHGTWDSYRQQDENRVEQHIPIYIYIVTCIWRTIKTRPSPNKELCSTSGGYELRCP